MTGLQAVVRALAESPEAGLAAVALEPQPRPAPGPGEAVVEVLAANVGWVDLLMTSGQYQHVPAPPYTPGLEYAGQVVAVGEGAAVRPGALVIADGLHTGPRSLGAHRAWGGFATWAVAPATALLPLPSAYSAAEGACLLGGAETAWHALVHRARLVAGESVLVLGATGSTGLAAVQLALARGARVLAVGRSAEKLEVPRQLGAEPLVCGTPGDLRDLVRARLPEGVEVVYDAVGGELSVAALRATRFGGRFVLVGWAGTPTVARGGRDPNQLPTNLVLMKGIDVLGSPAAITAHRDPALRARRLAEVFAAADELRPHVGATFPLTALGAALRAKWDCRVAGNVVVMPRAPER